MSIQTTTALGNPMFPSIYRLQNRIRTPNYPTGSIVDEKNRFEIGFYPATLECPSDPSIGRVENNTIITNDPPPIGIYEIKGDL